MDAMIRKEQSNTGALLVSYSFSEDNKGVLIIGEKRPNKDVDIVNAFQGEEAWELYKKLITKKGE